MSQASLQPRRDYSNTHYSQQIETPFNSPPSYISPLSQPYSSSSVSQGLLSLQSPSLPNLNSIGSMNGMPGMNHMSGMGGGVNNGGMNHGMNTGMNNGMGGMNSMGMMNNMSHQPVQLPGHLVHQQNQVQSTRDLEGTSFRSGDKIFSLVVRQQPIRARMCGFGDKDRRPITPPPCIQLIVTDARTGKEMDPNEIDSSYFILTVDLWDQNGSQEVNLVRHSNSSPAVSISAATTVPYPPPPDRPFFMSMNPMQLRTYPMGDTSPAMHNYYQSIGDNKTATNALIVAQQQQQQSPPTMYPPQPGYGSGYVPQSPTYAMTHHQASSIPVPVVPTPTAGMFTRNLIGSLSVNAFKLVDPDGKIGFWFILQDLSVRTEGMFRLKMNFVDVANPDGQGTLNRGKAPVLATQYSDIFQVYSAKKFPGVIESTDLSKCFAGQGIKIPIRKDGPKVPNQAEFDNDD